MRDETSMPLLFFKLSYYNPGGKSTVPNLTLPDQNAPARASSA
jgi:hypothetical protein